MQQKIVQHMLKFQSYLDIIEFMATQIFPVAPSNSVFVDLFSKMAEKLLMSA